MDSTTAYLLRLGDNSLILSQRLSAWCGRGPALEEDMALTNVALDLLGQTRMWYGYASDQENAGRDENLLAFHRDAHDFHNCLLVEQDNGSYADTLMRQFLFDAFHYFQLGALAGCSDERIAAIAAKSLKEVRYHFRHSLDWLVRLGDGTAQSHARSQAAVDHLMPYTSEYWSQAAINNIANSETAAGMATLQASWDELVNDALEEAGLQRPRVMAKPPQGKNGQHSEHLAPLLADMQSLARAHPQAQW